MDSQTHVLLVSLVALFSLHAVRMESLPPTDIYFGSGEINSSYSSFDKEYSVAAVQCTPCLSNERQQDFTTEMKSAEVAMWSGGVVVPSVGLFFLIVLNMLKQRVKRQLRAANEREMIPNV